MASINAKSLNNAIAICLGSSIYWFIIICRLLYYYLKGS